VTTEKMDVMFEAFDLLKVLVQRIESHDTTKIDLSTILPKLDAIARGDSVQPSTTTQDVVASQASNPTPRESEIAAPVEQMTVDTEAVEVSQKPAEPKGGQQPPPNPGKAADSSIRVDVSRLDALMNLVGELVLGRNQLAQIAHKIGEEHENFSVAHELAETNAHIDFITTELQMAVMKTRMIPISKVFNKLPRLIREVSKETGKEVELVILGEETELDKTLIEELNDPMVHLLRNAADHGIELPADRVALGKPAKGVVTIKAEHEGNHFIISIEDDGKGMDPEMLKRKAVERGMVTEAQAREMTMFEAFNLIFAPGFSTAQKVTNVSGRGVGMDVVRTNIQKLKGTIEIESHVNVGSKFVIKLPLTLAILQALLVEAAGEIFSIPLESVLEVVKIDAKDLSTINGREVIRLRETILPVSRLGAILCNKYKATDAGSMYIVVVGFAEQRLGLVIDSLLGQREIVIKNIGEYLGNIKGIAGSSILGDGRVIMIIDIGELMKLCQHYAQTECRRLQAC
jgi:two-component system, chemotaxis family, sensor kinase CheA